MKILHTADWHLGQKFIYNDRQLEHEMAFEWLLQLIQKEKVDAIIVAGDIFDIGNPPNYARRMYYDFLRQLLDTPCRHIVIIGGNHDSPAMLEAPKEFFKSFHIHVVGHASENPSEDIIELKDKKGNIEAIVAAVPFLRDRDIRASMSGEGGLQRVERIRAGILGHYQKTGELVTKYESLNVPIIATGHLYAQGANATDKQDNIYIGDTQNIAAEQFPEVFDYVALGHIHRAQAVGGLGKVRYSGSILPLSFSEVKDEKGVNILTFENRKIKKNLFVETPIFRRLKTITGSLAEVESRLKILHRRHENELPCWVEVIVEEEKVIPNLDGHLRKVTEGLNLELLKIRTARQHKSLSETAADFDLDEMTPLEVFREKCVAKNQSKEDMESLELTFRELLDYMNESANQL